MTVPEAMNLLGLNERPLSQSDLELAMAQALTQVPRQHELLEEAVRCLSETLSTERFVEARLTHIERHSTREILLFDENRDAVMFAEDAAPELPVPFGAPAVDDALWMGDDSVIFEGEAAMMSELAKTAPDQPMGATIEAWEAPPPEVNVSGEWQLMLESLEAEGLIKPEEGFSDALSAQMIALHDTPPERLAAYPSQRVADHPSSAPLEPHWPDAGDSNASGLETPLFATPLITVLAQPVSPLEIPLFGASPPMAGETAQVTTFDESLLISHGSLVGQENDLNAPLSQTSRSVPASLKTLETLPTRKPADVTPLTIKPAALQPTEQPTKVQATGRASIASTATVDRRSLATKPAAPRTYRDAREQPTQVRRRRQPLAVWVLGIAALIGSAVFIAPNLAARVRDQLSPRATATVKPVTSPAVVQPRVVKPATVKPAQRQPASVNVSVARPSPISPVSLAKKSPTQPSVANSSVSKPSTTRPAVASPKPRAATVAAPRATPKPAPARVAVKPQVTVAPRVSPPSGASALPPVTRPEGFASAVIPKRVVSVKLADKPVVRPASKPAAIAAASPPPAPVASIEFQDQVAVAAQQLPGGLSRQEFGRQFLNRKQFEVWQAQGVALRFESFGQIPLETQVMGAEDFKLAALIPTVRPSRPERP